MLKLLDLFSGIGGFSLGMEATKRIKTIGFVEKDKFCQKVLNKNFKNIPIEEDIRNVKGQRYTADIVSGGFPCQPFSIAGKRRGTDDDRYLWDETIRVVRECKPKWFVGENVEGLINISMVKSCNRYKKIWKKKVSKSNVLLFQLQASVLGIKERESGLSDVIYQTPTTQDSRIGINNIGGNKHRVKRGSIALADQILFPTPRSCEMEGGVVKNVEINNGSFSRKNKKGVRFGVKLKDAVHKIYGTPKAQDSRAALTDRGKSNLGQQIHQEYNAKKLGGRLNPNFVEFLMGYPMNWTKIKSTE